MYCPVVFVVAIFVLHVRYKDCSRLVLIEVVFSSPGKVLKMCTILFRLSSFLIVRIFFLIFLLVSF